MTMTTERGIKENKNRLVPNEPSSTRNSETRKTPPLFLKYFWWCDPFLNLPQHNQIMNCRRLSQPSATIMSCLARRAAGGGVTSYKLIYSVLMFIIFICNNGTQAFLQPNPRTKIVPPSWRSWKPSTPIQVHLNARLETDTETETETETETGTSDLDRPKGESHTMVERDPETNDPIRQQMVYVDEYNCIGCVACAQIAPSTFYMEDENGRARVFQQWGDDDETIAVAIETCPVDCIHYVPYDELQKLEIERRDQIINNKSRLVGGDGSTPQQISGNSKARCPNCPTRGCDDCPMFLVGKNQPKYDFIGAVSVEAAPIKGRQRRKLGRSMSKFASDITDYNNGDNSTQLTAEQISERVFDSMDRDGDGTVLKSELIAAGMDMTAVNLLDTNRDGKIQRDEFLSAMKLIEEESDDGATKTSYETSSSQRNMISEELDDSLGELQPLERQELRLGGFEPYILISVLTGESSYETIKEYNADWYKLDEMTGGDMTGVKNVLDILDNMAVVGESITSGQILGITNWLVVGIQLASAVSAVAGTYATVVFSLSILYGKTALGKDRDEEYYIFMENTGLQRFRAFKAFSYGLLGWVVSLLLIVCDHAPGILQLPLLAASAVILVFGKHEYDVITAAAAPIFKPRRWNNKTK